MKNKKILLSIISIIFLISLITLTGCENKSETEGEKNSNPNSIVGSYELKEIFADNTTLSAEEWKKTTTMEHSLVINSDNTAIGIMKYKKNMTEELVTEENKYKYDSQYFYATEESIKDKKIYSYVFENGQIKLTVIGDTHRTVYTYKKK